jgi:hypothetical protein
MPTCPSANPLPARVTRRRSPADLRTRASVTLRGCRRYDEALEQAEEAIWLAQSRREWLRHPGFAVRATHVAARKARHHVDEAVRLARARGIAGLLARGLLGFGRLAAAEGRLDEARADLEEARRVAGPLDSPSLTEQIGKGLGALTQPERAT